MESSLVVDMSRFARMASRPVLSSLNFDPPSVFPKWALDFLGDASKLSRCASRVPITRT